MKKILISDENNVPKLLINADLFNKDFYPNHTFIEIDDDYVSSNVIKNINRLKVKDGIIYQIQDTRTLWNYLKTKGIPDEFMSHNHEIIFDEHPDTIVINEHVEIKPNLCWDVPTSNDLYRIMSTHKYTKQQVFDIMDQNGLILKYYEGILEVKTSTEIKCFSVERPAWFISEQNITIPSRDTIYSEGDISLQQTTDTDWIFDNLNKSNWNRATMAINFMNQWLYLDNALVLNVYKNNIPVDCFIIRQGDTVTELDYSSPFSRKPVLKLLTYDELMISRKLFKNWCIDAGYKTLKVLVDKKVYDTWLEKISPDLLEATTLEDGYLIKLRTRISEN